MSSSGARRALAPALVVLGLAAGCGGGDGASPTTTATVSTASTSAAPSTSSPSTSSPSTTESSSTESSTPTATTTTAGLTDPVVSSGPAFPADTSTQRADASGPVSDGIVSAVVTAQDGYEQVALTVRGPAGAVPGFFVSYVDTPIEDPTADPVSVAGSAYLQVFVSGVAFPPPADKLSGRVAGVGGVTEVVAGPAFEGMQQLFVGLDAQRGFRVRASEGQVLVQILTS